MNTLFWAIGHMIMRGIAYGAVCAGLFVFVIAVTGEASGHHGFDGFFPGLIFGMVLGAITGLIAGFADGLALGLVTRLFFNTPNHPALYRGAVVIVCGVATLVSTGAFFAALTYSKTEPQDSIAPIFIIPSLIATAALIYAGLDFAKQYLNEQNSSNGSPSGMSRSTLAGDQS